jgi:cytochrome c oxidase subunit 2
LFGLENAHSPNAEDINALYWVMMAVAVILVVGINLALIALVMRFRAERGREPRRLRSRRKAQFAVGGVFGALAVILFVLGVIYTDRASDVEASGPDGLAASGQLTAQRGIEAPSGDDAAEPLTIRADGQQWLWRYEYPDGTFSYYELVVPVDTAVMVELGSTDVVHRWSVPGLGGKFDAVPDQSNRTWFKADQEGVYFGTSYQFSGASYAAMRTQVRVVSVNEYQAWLEQQASDIQDAQEFVQERIAADTQPGGGAEEGGTSETDETGDADNDAPGGGGGSQQ